MDELRARLMKLHQEKLEVALTMNKETQIIFKLQELKDICEFMNMFLYD